MLLSRLFQNWPEFNSVTGEVIEFVPDSPDHLRAWLLVEAGYRTIETINMEDVGIVAVAAAKVAVEAAIRAHRRPSFVDIEGSVISVRVPDSIKFELMDQNTFADLNAKVEAVIWARTGLDAEYLLSGRRS